MYLLCQLDHLGNVIREEWLRGERQSSAGCPRTSSLLLNSLRPVPELSLAVGILLLTCPDGTFTLAILWLRLQGVLENRNALCNLASNVLQCISHSNEAMGSNPKTLLPVINLKFFYHFLPSFLFK